MTASLYGDKAEDIVELKMVISKDQTKPILNDNSLDVDYWGWFDNKKQDIDLVFPKRFLLNMCFPYGMDIEEQHNVGKAYRLEII